MIATIRASSRLRHLKDTNDGYRGFIGGGSAECIRVNRENKQSTKKTCQRGVKATGNGTNLSILEGEDVESVGSTTVLLGVTSTVHVALSGLEGSREVAVVTVALDSQ